LEELRLSHVRTLRHHFHPGSDPGPVWIQRTAEFSATLQRAPTQPIPIVRLLDGKRSFALVRWGMLPAWVKDPKAFSLLINERGESALEKPAFRDAMRRRRCLIPTDGFYEWQATGDARAPKRPYFVRARIKAGETASPLAFAGLWETWMGPNGEELDTAAIVTTAANRTLSAMHDRMPVFMAPEAFDRWLDCERFDAKEVANLIKPADDALLEAYPISLAVNRVANDSEALIAPASTQLIQEPPEKTKPRKSKANDDQPTLF
jgi:putative SOS response-associated peptidase YedK